MSSVTIDLPEPDLVEARRRAAADGIPLGTWLALATRVAAYVAEHGRCAPTASPPVAGSASVGRASRST